MKIISTNLSQPKKVIWKNKEVTTGIYKTPVNHELVLEKTDVKNDHVIDRRYHGGADKACYLYSLDHYPFWKTRYPDLDWSYGMFGENLTVEGLSESQIQIGDTYKIGTAVIQVSQPRQPCFKLGIKFEDQSVLKEFIAQPYSGVYVRIITTGSVKVGDKFELMERAGNGLSITEVYRLLYNNGSDENLKQKIVEDRYLPADLRKYILDRMKG